MILVWNIPTCSLYHRLQLVPRVIVIFISALVVVVQTGHDGVGDLLDFFPTGSELVRIGIRDGVQPFQRFIDRDLKLLAGTRGLRFGARWAVRQVLNKTE